MVLACATAMTACANGPDLSKANIANVSSVKSTFGPEFHVSEVKPAGIDPRLLSPQTIPPGTKFDPADCAKFAQEQALPPGLKGNMAATSAEGKGNRFIAIAVETSEPIPFNEPDDSCKKIGFSGGQAHGLVEVVESPQIDGVPTLATHRVVKTTVGGKPKAGELYNYVANLGTIRVIVTANPLVQADKPAAPIDTKRARDLLTAAVNAVKG